MRSTSAAAAAGRMTVHGSSRWGAGRPLIPVILASAPGAAPGHREPGAVADTPPGGQPLVAAVTAVQQFTPAAVQQTDAAAYHREMQELLRKERKAMRERQAAARAAVLAAQVATAPARPAAAGAGSPARPAKVEPSAPVQAAAAQSVPVAAAAAAASPPAAMPATTARTTAGAAPLAAEPMAVKPTGPLGPPSAAAAAAPVQASGPAAAAAASALSASFTAAPPMAAARANPPAVLSSSGPSADGPPVTSGNSRVPPGRQGHQQPVQSRRQVPEPQSLRPTAPGGVVGQPPPAPSPSTAALPMGAPPSASAPNPAAPPAARYAYQPHTDYQQRPPYLQHLDYPQGQLQQQQQQQRPTAAPSQNGDPRRHQQQQQQQMQWQPPHPQEQAARSAYLNQRQSQYQQPWQQQQQQPHDQKNFHYQQAQRHQQPTEYLQQQYDPQQTNPVAPSFVQHQTAHRRQDVPTTQTQPPPQANPQPQPPLQTTSQPQTTPWPQQPSLLPSPTASPRAPPRRAPAPAAQGLPDLLPGLKRTKSKGKPSAAGPSTVVTSTRRDPAAPSAAVTVRSQRKARAEFFELPTSQAWQGPQGLASAPGNTPPPYTGGYGYDENTGYGGSGNGGGGAAWATEAGWGSAPPHGTGVSSRAGVGSVGPGPQPSAGLGVPAAAPPPVNAAGASSSGASTEPMAGRAAGVGPAASSGSSAAAGAMAARDAAAKAQSAAADAPEAAAGKKKKPARAAALWLTSFVAAGITAGASGAAATGAAAATAAAAAKQKAPDVGALAAAMVRVAATRSARDLSASVTDLPASIPELQARLEAAVRAEQESELRALRALYASGSLRRLQREGVVLVGLTASEAGRMYRSTLWRFAVMQPTGPTGLRASTSTSGAGSTALPYHKLRPGASVIITRHASEPSGGGGGDAAGTNGGSLDAETGLPGDGVEGVVVEANKDHLVVALEGRAHDLFQAMVMEAANSTAAIATASAATAPGRNSRRSGGGSGSAPFLGWRLDQSVRDTTTRRHMEGIRRLGMWAEESAEARLGEARVRAVLAGSRSAAILAAEPPEWVKEDRWREDARTALAAQRGLNDSQRRAVAAALTRTVTLWQGPPGTGKTRTLLALIEVLVRVRCANGAPSPRTSTASKSSSKALPASTRRYDIMGPLLAVADTNAAVDNLVEGLAARGVAVVRLGPAAKARESLRHLSLEAQAEATPSGRKAVTLRSEALRKQELLWEHPSGGGQVPKQQASARLLSAVEAAAAATAADVRADLERAEAALRQAAAAVVASAEVVVSTCTAAGDSMLDGRPWRCVVVDEASQATEPSVLVALTRGSAFVVMAGDPRQLPPTVLSEAALQHGLDVTLFERVAVAGGVLPLLLDTQYRMHPAISAFPSAFFYGGKLRDGVEAADKPVPRGFPWPNPAKPLALLAVTGGREETSGGMAELAAGAAGSGANSSTSGTGSSTSSSSANVLRPRGAADKAGSAASSKAGPGSASGSGSGDRASYRNSTEALLALAVTQRLLAAGDVSSAAILTPYRGQVRLVEALARQRGLDVAWSAAGLEVAVSTVDGYQGREADVVVFSAVRANDRGAVGFLSDPRRMNVAITRPRRGLLVLADTATLTRGSADWATYVKWAKSQGIVMLDSNVIDVDEALDVDLVPSSDLDDENGNEIVEHDATSGARGSGDSGSGTPTKTRGKGRTKRVSASAEGINGMHSDDSDGISDPADRMVDTPGSRSGRAGSSSSSSSSSSRAGSSSRNDGQQVDNGDSAMTVRPNVRRGFKAKRNVTTTGLR